MRLCLDVVRAYRPDLEPGGSTVDSQSTGFELFPSFESYLSKNLINLKTCALCFTSLPTRLSLRCIAGMSMVDGPQGSPARLFPAFTPEKVEFITSPPRSGGDVIVPTPTALKLEKLGVSPLRKTLREAFEGETAELFREIRGVSRLGHGFHNLPGSGGASRLRDAFS